MTNASIRQFNFPTLIKFGPGAVKLLPDALKQRGLVRPLIVTDKSLAAMPMVEALHGMLGQAGMIPAVYAGVFGNPTENQVAAGVAQYHAHGADALVLIGGGAPLDVGKAIALMVNHPGHLFDYEDEKPGARPVDQPIPFIVAIPTTAGTGSEVGRSAVVSDNATHAKKIIFDPKLLPSLVLADPELTFGLPPAVTAATGFDALTHCVEAFLAKGFHPVCDGIALEGVRLVAENLVPAVKNGKDLAARSGMLAASLMGGGAFQKGLGVTHSCAHALSTVYDTHHGLANALMLEACLEFNRDVCLPKLARLGQTIGVRSASDQELANGFLGWVKTLKKDVGIPSNLRAVGVSDLTKLVEVASQDPCQGSNPKAVSRGDFATIYQRAL